MNNTHLGISPFSTQEVTPDKVNSIIKSLDANKAPGTDKMPMKLIFLASGFLSKPIPKDLSNYITSSLVSAYRKNYSSQHVLLDDRKNV